MEAAIEDKFGDGTLRGTHEKDLWAIEHKKMVRCVRKKLGLSSVANLREELSVSRCHGNEGSWRHLIPAGVYLERSSVDRYDLLRNNLEVRPMICSRHAVQKLLGVLTTSVPICKNHNTLSSSRVCKQPSFVAWR